MDSSAATDASTATGADALRGEQKRASVLLVLACCGSRGRSWSLRLGVGTQGADLDGATQRLAQGSPVEAVSHVQLPQPRCHQVITKG
jgi:hypothetical protein